MPEKQLNKFNDFNKMINGLNQIVEKRTGFLKKSFTNRLTKFEYLLDAFIRKISHKDEEIKESIKILDKNENQELSKLVSELNNKTYKQISLFSANMSDLDAFNIMNDKGDQIYNIIKDIISDVDKDRFKLHDYLDYYYPKSQQDLNESKKINKLNLNNLKKLVKEVYDELYQNDISRAKSDAARSHDYVQDAIESVGGLEKWDILTRQEQEEIIDMQKLFWQKSHRMG